MNTIDKRSKLWRNMSDDEKDEYIRLQAEDNASKPKAGGARPGAGRKPKIDEIALIEKLDSIIDQDDVIDVLSSLIMQSGDIKALTLYMNYRYGRARETKEITINPEQPLFNIDEE